MARVVVEGDEPNGLARMIADLIETNINADVAKGRLIESTRGAVQIDVPRAGVTVGLKFVPGTLTVTSAPVPGADVRIETEAETLMALSTVPLRFGLPDPATSEGRAVGCKLVTGALKVRGRPWRLAILTRAHRLVSANS